MENEQDNTYRELRNRINQGLEKTCQPNIENSEQYKALQQKLYELLQAAKETRRLQGYYLKSKSYSDLHDAKKAERRLDNLIQEIDSGNPQIKADDFDNNTNHP